MSLFIKLCSWEKVAKKSRITEERWSHCQSLFRVRDRTSNPEHVSFLTPRKMVNKTHLKLPTTGGFHVWLSYSGNRILGCIQRRITDRDRNVIIPVWLALVRSCLKYSVQLQSPQYKKDIDTLKRVQRRVTKMAKELKNIFYEERLEEDGLIFSGEEKAQQGTSSQFSRI